MSHLNMEKKMLSKNKQKILMKVCKKFIDLPLEQQLKFIDKFKKLDNEFFGEPDEWDRETKYQIETLFIDLMGRKAFGMSLQQMSNMLNK